MQYKHYIQAPDNRHLILYFNGWAMTPEAVEHLILPEGYDLLVVWDYRELDFAFDLSRYTHIRLLAWSMGVWACHRLRAQLDQLPIELAIAVCGTGYPMDDLWGIPTAIFRGTLESITAENRTRFNRRMCGGKSHRHLLEALERRSTEEIYNELATVYTLEQGTPHVEPDPQAISWDLAHIALEDRIIPADNQRAYWDMQGIRQVQHQAPHYLFGHLSHWDELWKMC